MLWYTDRYKVLTCLIADNLSFISLNFGSTAISDEVNAFKSSILAVNLKKSNKMVKVFI